VQCRGQWIQCSSQTACGGCATPSALNNRQRRRFCVQGGDETRSGSWVPDRLRCSTGAESSSRPGKIEAWPGKSRSGWPDSPDRDYRGNFNCGPAICILASFSPFSGIDKPGRSKTSEQITIPPAVLRSPPLITAQSILFDGHCYREMPEFNLGSPTRAILVHPSAPCLKFSCKEQTSRQAANHGHSCAGVLCRRPRTTNTNEARPLTQPGSHFKGPTSARPDFNTIASKSHTPPDVVQSTNCSALLARECFALH
jgi:hypothetical protein